MRDTGENGDLTFDHVLLALRHNINIKETVNDPLPLHSLALLFNSVAVHDNLDWIRIRIRIRILLFSSLTLKMPTKNSLKKCFSAYYFSEVHLNYFSKIKSQK
jgi:hypothetical protein